MQLWHYTAGGYPTQINRVWIVTESRLEQASRKLLPIIFTYPECWISLFFFLMQGHNQHPAMGLSKSMPSAWCCNKPSNSPWSVLSSCCNDTWGIHPSIQDVTNCFRKWLPPMRTPLVVAKSRHFTATGRESKPSLWIKLCVEHPCRPKSGLASYLRVKLADRNKR